jgi:hypothetical protein
MTPASLRSDRDRPVVIRIDELVIDGLGPRDGNRLQRAVEAELGRLFTERGIPGRFSRSADVVEIAAGARVDAVLGAAVLDDAALGIEIAREVFEGIEGPR